MQILLKNKISISNILSVQNAIGQGYGSACGNITITNGITIVTANSGGGDYSPSPIGIAYGDVNHEQYAPCGVITIAQGLSDSDNGSQRVIRH